LILKLHKHEGEDELKLGNNEKNNESSDTEKYTFKLLFSFVDMRVDIALLLSFEPSSQHDDVCAVKSTLYWDSSVV
jgi:hypothetical protein